MAKPNYDFERRQRELQKKAKKEEKLRRKAEVNGGTDAEGEPTEPPATDTPPPADPK